MAKASQELIDAFRAFREQAIWVVHCKNINFALFEGGEGREAMLLSVAGAFFQDLSFFLQEHWIALCGRLTDPPESSGFANLSSQKLLQLAQQDKVSSLEIESLASDLLDYRKKIRLARNKLVAHNDLKTHLANAPLAGHHKADVERFVISLNQFCDELGNAIGEGPLDFQTQPGPGDVIDFLKFLKRHNQFQKKV